MEFSTIEFSQETRSVLGNIFSDEGKLEKFLSEPWEEYLNDLATIFGYTEDASLQPVAVQGEVEPISCDSTTLTVL